MAIYKYVNRHNGPRDNDLLKMFKVTGVSDLDELIDKTVPESLRLKYPMRLPPAMSEYEYTEHTKDQ